MSPKLCERSQFLFTFVLCQMAGICILDPCLHGNTGSSKCIIHCWWFPIPQTDPAIITVIHRVTANIPPDCTGTSWAFFHPTASTTLATSLSRALLLPPPCHLQPFVTLTGFELEVDLKCKSALTGQKTIYELYKCSLFYIWIAFRYFWYHRSFNISISTMHR